MTFCFNRNYMNAMGITYKRKLIFIRANVCPPTCNTLGLGHPWRVGWQNVEISIEISWNGAEDPWCTLQRPGTPLKPLKHLVMPRKRLGTPLKPLENTGNAFVTLLKPLENPCNGPKTPSKSLGRFWTPLKPPGIQLERSWNPLGTSLKLPKIHLDISWHPCDHLEYSWNWNAFRKQNLPVLLTVVMPIRS